MPTLEEIAKLSQVSRSTVSRVINNDPHVRPETREKVWQVIKQLNYQPNAVARSLAAGRRESWVLSCLSVLLPHLKIHFFLLLSEV